MPDMKRVDLSNCTFNGIPLSIVIDIEDRKEIKTHHATEVRDMNFVKRLHNKSKFRNISGSRSSRVRVIFHREVGNA